MPRFAVSCTTHMLDERGLDGTSLTVVEAESEKAAAKAIMIDILLETDQDRRNDCLGRTGLTSEPDADDDVVDYSCITEGEMRVSDEEFEANRRKILDGLVKFQKGADYELYFHPEERHYRGLVYGLLAVQV